MILVDKGMRDEGEGMKDEGWRDKVMKGKREPVSGF